MGQERDRGKCFTAEGIALIEEAMQAKGWDREDLAGNAEFQDKKTIDRALQGIAIDQKSIKKIANALGLNFNALIDLPAKKVSTHSKSLLDSNLKGWQEICKGMLAKQKEARQLRKKATAIGAEVNVYVPLDLLEHKEQTRSKQDKADSDQRNQYQERKVVKTYEHDDFLRSLTDRQSKNKHIAIVGEAGAGKTTLLARIADELDKNQKLQIFVSLADLRERSLDDYIYRNWLPDALGVHKDSINEEQKNELFQQFQSGEIWLLLDGLDEMRAKSSADALEKINREIREVIGQSRVVLTSRLNVWDAYLNRLSGFDTFRMGDFSPEQVDKFISDWFVSAEKPESAPILQAKLKEPNRDRIRDMVRNPLRLALLCQTFYRDLNTELPETKAGLYELFVRYFYEWKPNIVDEDLTQDTLREELHLALGKLAIAGIDGDAGFRLSRSLAVKEMGDRLFKLASDVGWLTLIERDEQDQEVYAFYHASFQEYFAVLAINDWDFFLPKDHVDRPVQGKQYRVFESSWKEVILLWSGMSRNLSTENEVGCFIEKLLTFNDGCALSNDYKDLGYFAALDIALESRNLQQFDTILDQIIQWAFGYFDQKTQKWIDFYIAEEAQLKIGTISHEIIIKKLTELFPNLKNSENILDISNFLLRLNTNNSIATAIEYLFYLVRNNPKSEVTLKAMSIIGWHRDTIANNHYLTRIFVEFIFSLDLKTLFYLFDETNSKRLLELISSLEGNNEAIQLFTETFIQNPKFLINTLESFIHFGYGVGGLKELPKGTFLDNPQKFEKIGEIPNYSTRIELEDIYDDKGNDIVFDFEIYCFKVRELIDFIILSITLPEEIDFKRYIDASKYIGRLKEVLNMVNNVAGIYFGKDFEIDYENLESKDLCKITVKKLSQSINNEIYRDRHIDFTLCYEALWFCAQNMSYNEFYKAWHSQINIVKYIENQLLDCDAVQKEIDRNTEHPEIRCLVVDVRHLEKLTDQNLLSKRIWNGLQKQFPDFELPKVNDIGDLEYELNKLQRNLGKTLAIAAIYGNQTNEAIEKLCQNLTQIKTYQWTGEKDIQKLIANINAWLSELNVRQEK